LFAELCVKLARPGGRIGIILPNGYLGNRGVEYVALREYLLRNTRLVGIVAFPRFTFKKSGADVSASVVLLERRKTPIARAADSSDYAFYVGNIESVGWKAGDKKGGPVYQQDQMSGAMILDNENEPILDADFGTVLNDFLRSPVVDCFPWTISDRNVPSGSQTEGIDIEDIIKLSDLNLDPKRHSLKFKETQREIKKIAHFKLGDVLEPVPLVRFKAQSDKIYKYVEIENVGVGDYDYIEYRGWQLPSRAKLVAKADNIFIPHIWGCAGKWFIAAGECDDLLVTNGCAQLSIKSGHEKILLDLVVGLSSEAFCVQMRALSTGSDGLAEVSDDDLLSIILPKIINATTRERIEKQLQPLLTGESRFAKFAKTIIDETPKWPVPPARKSHCALI
jgi:type I restriction enzyme M protein